MYASSTYSISLSHAIAGSRITEAGVHGGLFYPVYSVEPAVQCFELDRNALGALVTTLQTSSPAQSPIAA